MVGNNYAYRAKVGGANTKTGPSECMRFEGQHEAAL